MSLRKLTASGAGSGSESGSVSQRYGAADPVPDPYQNVTDPQHLWRRTHAFLSRLDMLR
jgi:hypothetical protein